MPRYAGRWLLLAGALGFAVLGQFYFARKPNYVYDGLVFYSLSVLLFLATLRPRRPEEPAGKPRVVRFSAESLVRAVPVAAALLLGLAVVLQLTDGRQNYWPIFWTWAAAAALYLAGFMPWPFLRGAREIGRSGASSPLDARHLAVAVRPPAPARALAVPEMRPGAAFSAAGGGQIFAAPGLAAKPRRSSRWRALGVHWEWLAVGGIVLAAVVLRTWHVDTIPWTLGGDEGSQGLWARAVVDGIVTNMFGLGWLSVPNMSFFFQAAWFRILGDSVMGLRLPWAIVGTLTVVGVYLLVRRLFGRAPALLTAFLLTTYHYHIHYSRLGSNQIADPFFMVWALYFLVIGMQGRHPGGRRWAWAATGMVAGLSFYFYAGARQVPIILAILLAWALVSDRRFWHAHKLDILVLLGGFLVVFGPMGLIAWQQPADFNARLNQVGIFQSGWIERAMKATGRTQLSILLEQFQRSFLAFNLYTDRVSWYGAGIPLMDFTASIFMVLGGAFSLSRLRPATDRADLGLPPDGLADGSGAAGFPGWRYAIFVVWFASVVVLGGALTENPPSSQRLVSSAVPAVFFVSMALLALGRAVGDLLDWPAFSRAALATAMSLALALISVRYYFGPYQASWSYGNINAETATRAGYYLRDLGPGWQEYFFGAPRMYVSFGSTPFIVKDVGLTDVTQPLDAPFPPAASQHKLLFVFLPERSAELRWVRRTYPGGTEDDVHRIGEPDGPLLFIAYRVQ